MNLGITLEQYNSRYIHLLEPTKNNIIPNSDFNRIYYSNNDLTLNAIYLIIEIKNISIEMYYNKYKCNFDISDNDDIIHKLKLFEKDILNKYKIPHKIPIPTLYNQLNQGYIKIYSNTHDINKKSQEMILKISGIWNNNNEYGITYKFLPIFT